ncbi:MAG TPA: nucleotidyltransferase domain-containing protein [Bdellovibrionota bacterium]|nr:nucleotidyltransferase domain-containing protein [Bdellovibrionota bacterium]
MAAQRNGRILLRIPGELHGKLRDASRREEISLNGLLNRIIARGTSIPTHASEVDQPNNELVRRIRHSLGDDLEAIVLFGSAARREESALSDVDLLIVLSAGKNLTSDLYHRWAHAFSQPSDRRLSPHFAALPLDVQKVGSLWFEAALEGVVLWDRSERTGKLLMDLRGQMAEQKLLRKWSHGHPYWVRTE